MCRTSKNHSIKDILCRSKVILVSVLLVNLLAFDVLQNIVRGLFPSLPWWGAYLFEVIILAVLIAPASYALLFYSWKKQFQTCKQRTEELLKSNHFTSGIIDTLEECVCVIDGEGRALSVNRPWLRFVEENPGASIAVKPGSNFFMEGEKVYIGPVPQVHTFVEETRKVVCGEKEKFSMEISYPLGQSIRWMQCRVVPLFLDGSTLAVISATDITDQKVSHEELRRSEARYRTLFESSGGALAVLQRDCTITEVNHKFEEITGYGREKITGTRKLSELVSPSDAACDQTLSEVPLHREVCLNHPDGKIRHALLAVSCIPESGHFLASFIDFTLQRELKEKLRKNEVRLQQQNRELTESSRILARKKEEWERTVDGISDLILLVSDAGIILRCNRAFKDFAARSYPEIIGSPLAPFFPEFELGFNGSGRASTECFHGPSGKWFAIHLSPIAQEGGAGEFVLTFSDITTIKKVTTELEEANLDLENALTELQNSQAHALQREKMASLGQLSAGIAHEINNPIGYVGSNLGTLQKYFDRLAQYLQAHEAYDRYLADVARAELEDKRRKLKIDQVLDDILPLIEECREGTDRVARIVQDLKGFTHTGEKTAVEADLTECLEKAINISWNELKYKVKLQREYADVSRVYCFPQQLIQVFMNLLVNAAHAIDSAGEIILRVWESPEHLCVSISDNGAGIPKENLDRIFDPFFTTKEIGKGTGLGLSLSYEIIKKHGGTISVESQPGEGTTFEVQIPKDHFPSDEQREVA